MKIEHVQKTGQYLTERLTDVAKERLVKLFGEPNTTELDDPDKVSAAWGLRLDGDFVAIWSYKGSGDYGQWSVYSEGQSFESLMGLLGE